MARWFNIGGPCNAVNHYMLPAIERLPEVATLIRKGQYFVVHAPQQSGKTTALSSVGTVPLESVTTPVGETPTVR